MCAIEPDMVIRFPSGELVQVASVDKTTRDGSIVWLIKAVPYYTRRNCSGLIETRSEYLVPDAAMGSLERVA